MIPFLHIGIAIAIFAIIFFLSRRPLRLEDITASALLFFLALPMFFKLAIIGALNIPVPDIILSVKSYPFTFGPLLYLYTKFEIDTSPVLKKKYLLHFLPFIIFAILPFAYPQFEPDKPTEIPEKRYSLESKINKYPLQNNQKRPGITSGNFRNPHDGLHHPQNGLIPPPDFKKRHGTSPDRLNEHETRQGGIILPPGARDRNLFERPELNAMILFTLTFTVISFLVYTIIILMLLQRHKKNISEYFSYDSIKLNLRWLRWATICFALSYSFVFITAQLSPKMYSFSLLDPRISPDIALTFFIFTFSFFAVKQPAVFPGTDKTGVKDDSGNKVRKYEKSGLKTDEADNYLDILEKFMKAEKPFLESDLTIQDLSERLSIPRHYLTQVINEKLKMNFFMYINEYRINEAKRMMTDKKYKDYTILRIAYESGFNSKSVFNTVFKKLTGYTPTEYRDKSFSAG